MAAAEAGPAGKVGQSAVRAVAAAIGAGARSGGGDGPGAIGAGAAELGVFALVFGFYAWTASPSIGFLDSPELTSAAVTLGVPHSPGHPLPSLIGRLVGYLPLGDLAVRVNLASAVVAAMAAAVLLLAGRRLLDRIAPELGAAPRTVIAAGAALGYAIGWAAWGQAVRAEVYALHALLCAIVLAGALAWDAAPGPPARRHLQLAGLAGGLALANHHLTALLLLAPLAGLILIRRGAARPSVAAIAITALAGVIGLAAYLYLPVRALAHPRVDWGAPSTAARFLWTVSGAAFAKNAGGEHASSFGEDAAQVVAALIEDLGPAATLLALLGLALAARRGLGRVALTIALVTLLAAVGRALFGFDPETPDHHAYLLPALLALSLAAAIGGGAVTAALARGPGGAIGGGRATAIAGVLAALVVGGQLALGRSAAATWAYAADDLGAADLAALPPRAVAITTYFQTDFRSLALATVDGARPDVAWLDRGMLTYPGGLEEARRRDPDLAALLEAPLRVGAPAPLAALGAIAAHRPVAFELDPTLDPPLLPHLVPRGRFAAFAAEPPDPATRAAAEGDDAAARGRLAAILDEAAGDDRDGALAAVLWYDFNRVGFYCATGRGEAAASALAFARPLAPGDRTLDELAARCAAPAAATGGAGPAP